jgi:hypothetical protein
MVNLLASRLKRDLAKFIVGGTILFDEPARCGSTQG